jgi:general stress protein 26
MESAINGQAPIGMGGGPVLAELIALARTAMLVSRAPDGSVRGWPLELRTAPFNGALWFMVQADGELALQVRAEPRVLLALGQEAGWHLSLRGVGRLLRDADSARDLWTLEDWSRFPGGPGDRAVALLCVSVHDAEWWRAPHAPPERFRLFEGTASA